MPKPMAPMQIDYIWECPKCGAQIGIGEPGKFSSPPTCTMGHGPTEMEQKKVEAWNA